MMDSITHVGINGMTTNGNGPEKNVNGHINGAFGGTAHDLSDDSSAVRLNGSNNDHFLNGVGQEHHSPQPTRTHFLLPFSAHDEKTLQGNFGALQKTGCPWELADVAYSLSERRSMLTYRAFVVAEADKAGWTLGTEKLAVTKK